MLCRRGCPQEHVLQMLGAQTRRGIALDIADQRSGRGAVSANRHRWFTRTAMSARWRFPALPGCWSTNFGQMKRRNKESQEGVSVSLEMTHARDRPKVDCAPLGMWRNMRTAHAWMSCKDGPVGGDEVSGVEGGGTGSGIGTCGGEEAVVVGAAEGGPTPPRQRRVEQGLSRSRKVQHVVHTRKLYA